MEISQIEFNYRLRLPGVSACVAGVSAQHGDQRFRRILNGFNQL